MTSLPEEQKDVITYYPYKKGLIPDQQCMVRTVDHFEVFSSKEELAIFYAAYALHSRALSCYQL